MAREHLEWTAVELASRSGVANTTIGALENRDSKRSEYSEQLIAAFPRERINRDWLRSGKGEMVPANVIDRMDLGRHDPQGYEIQYSEQAAELTTPPPLKAWEHSDLLPPGETVLIPLLDVVPGINGDTGKVMGRLLVNFAEPFRADWIRRKKVRPDMLGFLRAPDDLMQPRFFAGDALVVDTDQIDPKGGGIFVLWYAEEQSVRRLQKLPGGGLRILADASEKHDIVVRPGELEHVHVIGRVVQITSEGGL